MVEHPFALFTEQTETTNPNNLPRISLEDAEVLEEEGRVRVNVVLDRANNRRVSLRYFTFDYDNQGVGWRDYIPKQGRLVFKSGETEKQIVIDLNKDDIPEGDKTFGVKIFELKNATIADDVAIITLKDEQPINLTVEQPIISIANNQIILPSADNNQLEFTVSLTEPTQETVTVKYNTLSLSAVAEQDFTPQEGLLTFAPGELTQTITVEILGNQPIDNPKTFAIELSEPENAQFSTPEVSYFGVGGILNKPIKQNGIFQPVINAKLPRINMSISDGLVRDNEIEFTVSLDRESQKPIRVRYFSFADTNLAEYPFITQDNSLIFQPGETQKNLTISLVDNWQELANDTNIIGVKLYQAQGAKVIDDFGMAMKEVENSDDSEVEITTLAIGEEGGFDDDTPITTQAIGEEGGFDDDTPITTQAIGEEGGFDDTPITTQAIGEEGGFDDGIINQGETVPQDEEILPPVAEGEMTTYAVGEEGGFDDNLVELIPEEMATTYAVGEEGGGLAELLPPIGENEISTRAIGEEGGFSNKVGDFLTNSGDDTVDLSFL